MEQKNYSDSRLRPIHFNNGITIFQGPNRRDFGSEVNRVDQVFYIETNGKVRYTKDDIIKALEFLYLNMIYDGEREKLRQILRRVFHL